LTSISKGENWCGSFAKSCHLCGIGAVNLGIVAQSIAFWFSFSFCSCVKQIYEKYLNKELTRSVIT